MTSLPVWVEGSEAVAADFSALARTGVPRVANVGVAVYPGPTAGAHLVCTDDPPTDRYYDGAVWRGQGTNGVAYHAEVFSLAGPDVTGIVTVPYPSIEIEAGYQTSGWGGVLMFNVDQYPPGSLMFSGHLEYDTALGGGTWAALTSQVVVAAAIGSIAGVIGAGAVQVSGGLLAAGTVYPVRLKVQAFGADVTEWQMFDSRATIIGQPNNEQSP